MNTVKTIYKTYGFRGYYRGMHLAMLKSAPAIYLQFALYDYLKQFTVLSEKEPSMGLIDTSVFSKTKTESVPPAVSEETTA